MYTKLINSILELSLLGDMCDNHRVEPLHHLNRYYFIDVRKAVVYGLRTLSFFTIEPDPNDVH
jgi:hypothetical protein